MKLDGIVRLNVPHGASTHFQTPDGHLHEVAIDAAGRFIKIRATDAQMMLHGGNYDLRNANAALLAALGPLRQPQGVNVARLLDQQRERRWDDIGGRVMDALRETTRWPR